MVSAGKKSIKEGQGFTSKINIFREPLLTFCVGFCRVFSNWLQECSVAFQLCYTNWPEGKILSLWSRIVCLLMFAMFWWCTGHLYQAIRLTGYVLPYELFCSVVIGWNSTAVIGTSYKLINIYLQSACACRTIA